MTIAASLAQIGEFSFILAALGVSLGLLPQEGRDLILAGSTLSILLNPLLFAAAEHGRPRATSAPAAAAPEAGWSVETPGGEPSVTAMADHDVLAGYGRVGALVGAGLLASGRPLLVFEEDAEATEAARRDGAEVVAGNAADPEVLAAAHLRAARQPFVTIPEPFEAGQVVALARAPDPALEIIARAHSDAAVAHLTALGAELTIMGEREIASRMLEHARARRGTDDPGAGVS